MSPTELPPCVAPAWAPNGHAQTILGFFMPAPSLPKAEQIVEIPLPDGDRLIGLFHPGPKPVTVAVFHGLSGCTDSRYMKRTASLAAKLGFSCLLVNHRGCGPGKGLAKWPYHSGRGEDVSEALQAARRLRPRDRLIAVGFSLSGNALLLLLSGARGTHLPDAAVSVNAPIELGRAAEELTRGWNRIYDRHFVYLCRKSIEERRRAGYFKDEFRVPFSVTLGEFDDWYTAPAGGFRDRHDYYEQCSTAGRLHAIRTPTVVLTAEDDPFVPVADYRAARLSSSIHLHIERQGGHMGYLSRGPKLQWLDLALEHYLCRLAAA